VPIEKLRIPSRARKAKHEAYYYFTVAGTIFVPFFSELLKMHREEILRAGNAKTISNRGAVGYSGFILPPPSPPSPVGIGIIGGVIKVSTIIRAVRVFWAFAKDIAHLIS